MCANAGRPGATTLGPSACENARGALSASAASLSTDYRREFRFSVELFLEVGKETIVGVAHVSGVRLQRAKKLIGARETHAARDERLSFISFGNGVRLQPVLHL